MDYISDNEYMQIRMNSISELVNRDLVMLRKENEALLRRAEAAEKIVGEYAESARAIALWLSAFCDKSLSHLSMISNAARKVSLAYADMEARAEKAERERDAAISDLTYIARTYTVDLCDDLVSIIRTLIPDARDGQKMIVLNGAARRRNKRGAID